MVIAYRLQFAVTSRVQRKKPIKYCLTIVFPIIAMVAPIVFKNVAKNYLTVRGNPLYILSFARKPDRTTSSSRGSVCRTHRIAESIIASPRINPRGLNAQLIRITSQLVSLLARP